MTEQEFFNSAYYFPIGVVFAIICLWIHVYSNKGDKDIVLDFIAIGTAIICVIAWPIILFLGIFASVIFGAIYGLAFILNKIRTR